MTHGERAMRAGDDNAWLRPWWVVAGVAAFVAVGFDLRLGCARWAPAMTMMLLVLLAVAIAWSHAREQPIGAEEREMVVWRGPLRCWEAPLALLTAVLIVGDDVPATSPLATALACSAALALLLLWGLVGFGLRQVRIRHPSVAVVRPIVGRPIVASADVVVDEVGRMTVRDADGDRVVVGFLPHDDPLQDDDVDTLEEGYLSRTLLRLAGTFVATFLFLAREREAGLATLCAVVAVDLASDRRTRSRARAQGRAWQSRATGPAIMIEGDAGGASRVILAVALVVGLAGAALAHLGFTVSGTLSFGSAAALACVSADVARIQLRRALVRSAVIRAEAGRLVVMHPLRTAPRVFPLHLARLPLGHQVEVQVSAQRIARGRLLDSEAAAGEIQAAIDQAMLSQGYR